jgi:hypothetical protein
MKIAGSGSISQRHGSADPDPDPDPHQNVMDPQHWRKIIKVLGFAKKKFFQRFREII